MKGQQVPVSPPNDLGKALKVSPALWPAMASAVCELALARVRHGRAEARDLLGANLQQAGPTDRPAAAPDAALIGRVTYLIPRIARRMPWRSDCLIQALAAQRWLARSGIASSIRIGTRTSRAKGFEAHAWLVADEQIVTGWDIEHFAEFAAFPDHNWPAQCG